MSCTKTIEETTEKCDQEADQGYSDCAEQADQGYDECTQKKDDGYNKCTEEKDIGYNSCSQTADQGYSECCDWKPCKWFCDAYVWVSNIVCVAWTWISNVVCVGWTWFSNIVCVVWTWVSKVVCVSWTWVSDVVCLGWSYITKAICVAWDVLTTVFGAIVETLLSALGWLLNGIAFVIEMIFSIPVIGRFFKWVWNVVVSLFTQFLGLIDAAACALGICPEKKLRVCTIIMSDPNGNAFAEKSEIVAELQNTINIYRTEANVRVIPTDSFYYTSALSGAEVATEDWVQVYNNGRATGPIDVNCQGGAFSEDLGIVGAGFEVIACTKCFSSNFRRVLGYGAPVVAFYVRTIAGSDGCSLGPLSDYITIEGRDRLTAGSILSDALPHELGHACNLWHISDSDNLMNPSAEYKVTGIHLKKWQVVILRNSRHVTYF